MAALSYVKLSTRWANKSLNTYSTGLQELKVIEKNTTTDLRTARRTKVWMSEQKLDSTPGS